MKQAPALRAGDVVLCVVALGPFAIRGSREQRATP